MTNAFIRSASGSVKTKKRRGRGNASGLGGEAGRGHKGQKSRTGYSARSGFEGGQMPLYRRLPKKRGLGNTGTHETSVINLGMIEKFFENGDVVDYVSLREKGLVKKNRFLKVLGVGELTKKVTVRAHFFSKSAEEKLAKSGITVEKL